MFMRPPMRSGSLGRGRGSHRSRPRNVVGARPTEGRGRAGTLCYIGKTARSERRKETDLSAIRHEPQYQESRIEDEPILGPVLVLPSGRVQPLTFWERVLVSLRLVSAKTL